MILCAENYRLDDNLTFVRASNYGNGSTEGIYSSIFPLSSSSSFSVPFSDEEGGQSTGEDVWRLQSVDPCTSKLDTVTKYPSNIRKNTETHI